MLFDYATSRHKRTIADVCNVYIYIQYTYTSVRYIYLFLMHWNCEGLTSYIFGTVHSDRTVVVLLHKHFLSIPSPFFNSASVITNCQYAAMSKLYITVYVTFHSPFLSRLIASNSSSVPIAFHQFLTWIAPGDVDLRFSPLLLSSAVEEETKWAAWFISPM